MRLSSARAAARDACSFVFSVVSVPVVGGAGGLVDVVVGCGRDVLFGNSDIRSADRIVGRCFDSGKTGAMM